MKGSLSSPAKSYDTQVYEKGLGAAFLPMNHAMLVQMINAQYVEKYPETQEDKGFLQDLIHFIRMCK